MRKRQREGREIVKRYLRVKERKKKSVIIITSLVILIRQEDWPRHNFCTTARESSYAHSPTENPPHLPSFNNNN